VEENYELRRWPRHKHNSVSMCPGCSLKIFDMARDTKGLRDVNASAIGNIITQLLFTINR